MLSQRWRPETGSRFDTTLIKYYFDVNLLGYLLRHIYIRLRATTFDSTLILGSHKAISSSVMLTDIEHMGVAVGNLLLSCELAKIVLLSSTSGVRLLSLISYSSVVSVWPWKHDTAVRFLTCFFSGVRDAVFRKTPTVWRTSDWFHAYSTVTDIYVVPHLLLVSGNRFWFPIHSAVGQCCFSSVMLPDLGNVGEAVGISLLSCLHIRIIYVVIYNRFHTKLH